MTLPASDQSATPARKGTAAWSPEQRAANLTKAVAARYLKSTTWDWAAEMPRLRANVRAEVERIMTEAG
jgi:hypothetical protein